ncbi:nitroreductase family protein [Sphingomicrobium astaxanthinifaciens]|uniref:nitroreductase family protein n=1 Tax=Sphingomicrobium astaxanthinifaciens TaxID=1227949 RepID=UPI001FCC7D46|nr:nitroreductase [Sphingomicrobium astaxanthinifaciens]MCJ7420341.1 nitroreductase [Sphingomicrobium astaxanthinifaciens]
MVNDRTSLLDHLASRRSARPRDLVAPGPSPAQLARILELASRTPDHGKLVPWRFVVIEDRAAFADRLEAGCRAEAECHAAKIVKFRAKAFWAPTLVALVASPTLGHKIPEWEQQLCVGSVGMNLLHATHAHGYVGGWITGAQATMPAVVEALCAPGESIAGFFYIGTPALALTERERPDMDAIVTTA